MTDTEAKALALVNDVFMERCLNLDTYTNRAKNSYHEALCRAIERLEATEARHAAELREQAERFSEAARSALAEASKANTYANERAAIIGPILAPFIIVKPDPLVEALNDMKDGRAGPTTESYASCLHAALAARGYEVRKIGADQ